MGSFFVLYRNMIFNFPETVQNPLQFCWLHLFNQPGKWPEKPRFYRC